MSINDRWSLPMIGKTISHYKILERLGEGGMGVVYKAEDLRLKRTIALKFLTGQVLGSEEEKARFIHEAQAAAALTHSNICHVYEIDEFEGQMFIAMEYVDGENLKDSVDSGPMRLDKAVDLGLQIAEGLQKAHEKDIVHRDIKPANVVLTPEGQAKIMDFGMAKSPKRTVVTQEGITLGTVAYMSPEQARGEETDPRSDIWSLGAMLYEMVTGRRAFVGDYEPAVVYSILNQTQEPLTSLRTGVPMELERIVDKCLAKDKGERYQTATELAADLRRLKRIMAEPGMRPLQAGPSIGSRSPARPWLWAFAAVAVVILAVALARHYSTPSQQEEAGPAVPGPAVDRKMLVVLPFENLGQAEDEYFADGITEEITSRLAVLRGLGVISRTSAFHYKNTDKTLRQIGEELGVDYVLEGTVRWEHAEGGDSRVRVTPQLIRVSDDTHVWAEGYDAELKNVFAVQSQIAEKVTSTLGVTLLDPERKAIKSVPTENLGAYNAYLRGMDLSRNFDLAAEAMELTVQMFERAVKLDPKFALAYAELSRVHSRVYLSGSDRSQDRARMAKETADKALELSPELPEAHLALGYYYYWCMLDYDRAMEELAIVETERPNDTWMLKGMGFIKRRQGRFGESLKYLKAAIALDPRDAYCANEIGNSYTFLRQYADAQSYYDLSISIVPDQISAYDYKAWNTVFWRGDAAAALDILAEVPVEADAVATHSRWWFLVFNRDYKDALDLLEQSPYDVFSRISRWTSKSELEAKTYLLMGDRESAKAAYESARIELEAEVAKRPDDYRVHGPLGVVYAHLDRKEDAIREGRICVELCPIAKDALMCPWALADLAEIYAIVGERDAAFEQIEYLLSIPGWMSVKLLEVLPQFAEFRDDPRFQRLIEEYSPDPS